MSYQSNAVEEGYDSDGDQVVDKFLKARDAEKKAKLLAEAAAKAAAIEAGKPKKEVDDDNEEPRKVIFRAPKRDAVADSVHVPVASLPGISLEAREEVAAESQIKKRPKKTLDNKK
jgi:hypothetical protein